MPFALPQFCLGRLSHDPEWYASVDPHVPADTIPETVRGLDWTPTLASNLSLPTCAVAGLANGARIAVLRRGYDLVSSDDALLTFYARLAGCDDTPAAIAATAGLRLQDVLEAASGPGFDVGEQAPLVEKFRAVQHVDHLRDVIARFGSAYLGIMLHEEDVADDAVWVGAASGPSYGRHCVVAYAYGAEGFSLATWGTIVSCDSAFLASRLDEAYAIEWLGLAA
jgi:hypothetical protein